MFMYRNLDKNIRSFMALMRGLPDIFYFLFRPKFIGFLKGLIPPNSKELEEKILKVLAHLVDSKSDLRGHCWTTLFVALHILHYFHARDKVPKLLSLSMDISNLNSLKEIRETIIL